jgi:pyruvate formate lyase activating enzyme
MPVVPGYTDTEENIDAAIEFLQSIGHRRIHLLPYHSMGEVKIDLIQGKQPKLGLSRHTDEELSAVARRFEAAGIEVANRSSLS